MPLYITVFFGILCECTTYVVFQVKKNPIWIKMTISTVRNHSSLTQADLQLSGRPVSCRSHGGYRPCRCSGRCPPSSPAESSEFGCYGSEWRLKSERSWLVAAPAGTSRCAAPRRSGQTWALHHSLVVFGPQHRRARPAVCITVQSYDGAQVDSLISRVAEYPCSLQTWNQCDTGWESTEKLSRHLRDCKWIWRTQKPCLFSSLKGLRALLLLRERRRNRQVLSWVLMFFTWQAYRPSSLREALGIGSSRVTLVPSRLDCRLWDRGVSCRARERHGCTEDSGSASETLATRNQARPS